MCEHEHGTLFLYISGHVSMCVCARVPRGTQVCGVMVTDMNTLLLTSEARPLHATLSPPPWLP